MFVGWIFKQQKSVRNFEIKSAIFHSINLMYLSFEILAVVWLMILFVWYNMLRQ